MSVREQKQVRVGQQLVEAARKCPRSRAVSCAEDDAHRPFHAAQRSACEDPGKRYAQSGSEPIPEQAPGLERARQRRRCRGIPQPQRSRRLFRWHAHCRVPVVLRTREPAACKAPADPANRLTPPCSDSSRRVHARLQAVAAAAWRAIDADVVVTEARIVGSIRPLAASWPPDRRRADPHGAADTFPARLWGPTGQPRWPRKGHGFLGVLQLEPVLSSRFG